MISCTLVFLYAIVACNFPKTNDTTEIEEEVLDTAAQAAACHEDRSLFYGFINNLATELNATACTSDDECDYLSLKKKCGISCGSYIINYELHGATMNTAAREYAEENCDQCEEYLYEPCMEPEQEPPSCVENTCRL